MSGSKWTGSLVVVEDNDLDFERIDRTLSKVGFAGGLHRAGDGVAALDVLGRMVNKPEPCVVMLDLNLPRMSGIEFLDALRSDSRLRHVPVHVLTTSTRPADICCAWQRMVSGYHVKPTSLGELRHLLAGLLDLWARSVFVSTRHRPDCGVDVAPIRRGV